MSENSENSLVSASGQPLTSAATSVPSERGRSSSGAQATTGPSVPSLVVDVSDADFATYLELSNTVPIVVDLWAEWCGPCKQLSPILEKVTESYQGRVVLAKVDVDANPQLAQAFQAQSIPTVVALLKGQALPLFQGAVPEQAVRQVFEQLLQQAAAYGVSGQVTVGDEEADQEELSPEHQAALAAISAGEHDQAISQYQAILEKNPQDTLALSGLDRVKLLQRTTQLDAAKTREAAAADPHNIEAQLAVADLDVVGGHVEDGFARLVHLISETAPGEQRDQVRERLLELFQVVGKDDERVRVARVALTNALF